MKIKTERQAWLYLAKLWDEPEMANHFPCLRLGGDWPCYGLCDSIHSLNISVELARAMEQRMLCVRDDCERDDYWWPLSKRGAKQRAAFCRKMAKQCATKRKRVTSANR